MICTAMTLTMVADGKIIAYPMSGRSVGAMRVAYTRMAGLPVAPEATPSRSSNGNAHHVVTDQKHDRDGGQQDGCADQQHQSARSAPPS